MVAPADVAVADVAAAERALERLFRLTMSRRAHTQQTAALGADVTRTGYAVLRSLEEAGELTMGELAREASMDPGAAARQVRALEDDALVARGALDGDGRVVVVRLTDAGRDVYRRIVAMRTAHMAAVLAAWAPSERRTLAELVDRLVHDLKAVPFRLDEGA